MVLAETITSTHSERIQIQNQRKAGKLKALLKKIIINNLFVPVYGLNFETIFYYNKDKYLFLTCKYRM